MKRFLGALLLLAATLPASAADRFSPLERQSVLEADAVFANTSAHKEDHLDWEATALEH